MKFIDKLKSLVLPKEINFFQLLEEQSILVKKLIDELIAQYTKMPSAAAHLFEIIKQVEVLKKQNIKELNSTFITPVDKEALSRVMVNLDWIALSVKHLLTEMKVYELNSLKEYQPILELLQEGAQNLSQSILDVKSKNFKAVTTQTSQSILIDDKLVNAYAKEVKRIASSNNIEVIIMHHDILWQLKEISKQIHLCTNKVEDIMFKMV